MEIKKVLCSSIRRVRLSYSALSIYILESIQAPLAPVSLGIFLAVLFTS
jgi:hypothetical protein